MAIDRSPLNGGADTNDRGLTLVEVCLAMLILSTAALAAARLSVVSLNMVVAARLQSETTVLAVQKVEQLRSLAWRFVDAGVLQPVGDSSTDLSQEPMTGGGGGLSPSPTGTLSTNTPGYVDYVDKHGRWVGTGPVPPGICRFHSQMEYRALAFKSERLIGPARPRHHGRPGLSIVSHLSPSSSCRRRGGGDGADTKGGLMFSLLEALVALALTLVLIGAAVPLVTSNSVVAATAPEMVDEQQRARLGAEGLIRDLTMAGAGLSVGATRWAARWPRLLRSSRAGWG